MLIMIVDFIVDNMRALTHMNVLGTENLISCGDFNLADRGFRTNVNEDDDDESRVSIGGVNWVDLNLARLVSPQIETPR